MAWNLVLILKKAIPTMQLFRFTKKLRRSLALVGTVWICSSLRTEYQKYITHRRASMVATVRDAQIED